MVLSEDFIATVTVVDDQRRDWELADQYSGFGTVPLPVIDDLGPDFHGAIRSVSDADDGYVKTLEVRPAGEKDWCELKARIGFGY